MESLRERADNLRKAGKHSQAVLLYSKAIMIGKGYDTLEILDGRAACLEALLQYDDALNDAKAMLRENYADARGYLRAGKIYQLLNRDVTALQYYERGLKMVSEQDKLRKILRKLYDTVNDRVSKHHKGRDPLSLPTDVVIEIISYLSFAQQMRAREVCKAWSNTLDQLPGTYANIDFMQGCRKMVKAKEIVRCLQRAKNRLKSFRCHVNSTDDLIRRILGVPTLRFAEISCSAALLARLGVATNLQHLVIHAIAQERGLQHVDFILILNTLRSLRSLEMRGFQCNMHRPLVDVYHIEPSDRLTSLDLGVNGTIDGSILKIVFSAFPSLLNLVIPMAEGWISQDIDFPARLTLLTMGRIVSSSTISLFYNAMPKTLEELSVDCRNLSIRNASGNSLQALQLEYPERLTEGELVLLVGSPDLQSLKLIKHALQRSVLQRTLSQVQNLKGLAVLPQFDSEDHVDDEMLRMLTSQNPRLHTLELPRCRRISGAALAVAVSRLPALRLVDITECDQIDLEVQAWIRTRGVRVVTKTRL